MKMFKVSETIYINLDMVTSIEIEHRFGDCRIIKVWILGDNESPLLYNHTDDLWNRLVKAMEAD